MFIRCLYKEVSYGLVSSLVDSGMVDSVVGYAVFIVRLHYGGLAFVRGFHCKLWGLG